MPMTPEEKAEFERQQAVQSWLTDEHARTRRGLTGIGRRTAGLERHAAATDTTLAAVRDEQTASAAWRADVTAWQSGVDVWGADADARITLAQETADLAGIRATQARDMAALSINDAARANRRITAATSPDGTWLTGLVTVIGWTALVLFGAWMASGLDNGRRQLGDHPSFQPIVIGGWLLGLVLITVITIASVLSSSDNDVAAPAPQPQPAPQPTPAMGTPAVNPPTPAPAGNR